MSKLNENEANLNFRVEKELRDQFAAACAARDITPSQELRWHMRDVIEKVAENSREIR
jgi:antitoxin component of RelBE/YafQ-DinJ toxin-antitoxin module